ncbi:uncharacterized protein LOC125646080 [Ostrea edulis]|uniref:uncharacterized protein LOC125646080 n=1 Tax=Ostrea edulis TaxID=37623 RepID=UPI0024AEA734|nr:uncharacterized protein LOC125646080 [Ostrea edulis]
MFGTYDIPTSAQVLGMLAPLFQTVAMVMILVGIGLPYWLIFGGTSYGIFQICTSSVTSCSFSITKLTTSHPDSVTYWKIMISLAIVGALFMFLSEIMIFIYPCKKVISHGKLAVGGVACFFCILGATLTLAVVGLMIGAASVSVTDVTHVSLATADYLGWGLYVSGSGAILALFTGILFSIHLFIACYY